MNFPKTKTLIVIAGPTAVGKTAAAIEVAKRFNTVVVSADSRQFFREMSIGTAKPDANELAQVKHYFIDSHSITEPFSVGDFERECLMLLDDLFKKHDYVVLAGGSGLYIKAICEGFDDLPTADPAIREQLNLELEEKGLSYLQEKLKQADPVYYNQVDLGNPQRIIRALEVFESTGNPISSYRQATVNKRPFHIIKLALNMPREVLYRRINHRVDIMMQHGLLAEATSLLPYRHLNALNTVGYAEIFDYMDGATTLDKAVEMIKQNTRRFAKRQLTWFRKDQQFIWFDAGAPNLTKKMVEAVENVS
ncbi:tRNA (adenosine(37)-N6)-dimethylallyltransferase MiaA [Mucilaginibacter sp. OK283]|jgi:tRNA dimethylallyltransferase|uniref:tRNA (adenosine(37)-N6)-dimethylallyltransferase MiaA n=1 Tax=Mucilaginibacter sp. OK283 TaxID=1881049 RepID=UPI0008BEB600|nr:tRNA (adenosine(37)-N6)-dimethylallyltransferase MiaA [Mucilaginibacter sp. OK283]SEP22092.1 tRNA dimethylallyltransferase [Mucilaginibacter sp. OK283]